MLFDSVLGTLLLQTLVLVAPAMQDEKPRSRTFLFTYAGKVTGLKPGQEARVWLPVPPSNAEQDVKVEAENLPAKSQVNTAKEHGNRILYFQAMADGQGEIRFKRTYRVTRHEVRSNLGKAALDDADAARFLKPDALVPVGGKALQLIKDKKLPKDPFEVARTLYDTVNQHMRYSKEGIGWGRGDSDWACDSKYGNCSDFHSLFMSLARAQDIPAKFEIGFPLPEKLGSGDIPGYHCWAKFHLKGKGWIPVDISEANRHPAMQNYYFGNLTANRVVFSTGRDLVLVPKQMGQPLNFFIYPYVEVDGKPYEKVDRQFSYEDVR